MTECLDRESISKVVSGVWSLDRWRVVLIKKSMNLRFHKEKNKNQLLKI